LSSISVMRSATVSSESGPLASNQV
jgi:hypothetical protein